MARICEICEKGTVYGNRKRHHHAAGWLFRAPRSPRTWKPNLRKAKVTKDGLTKTMTVCMRCYKRLHME
ncbi:MAG: L28 family ribosomal protein [bacterium]